HHTELVDGVRPDVIHYHNLSLLGLDLIDVPSSALKMYTAHDYWVRCPRNDLFKFNRRLCDKPTCLTCLTISGKPPQMWRYRPAGTADRIGSSSSGRGNRRASSRPRENTARRSRSMGGFPLQTAMRRTPRHALCCCLRSGTRTHRSSPSKPSHGARQSCAPRP